MSPRQEREETLTPEEWVAVTGDPEGDADYVQWLTGPENASLHERFSTVAHDDAITLVDAHPHPFDDGRVTYLSHTDDETLVVLQWGGPLATLGRLAGALFSEKALSNILSRSRLGQEFEAIDDEPDHDTTRILRRGHQVGWYSDTETTYQAWRDRITSVRDHLLSQVAKLTSSDDTAARRNLFNDLHGLIASATQLYHAVGLDLTTTIRVPDTDALARNTTQLRDFCEFFGKTALKQSVYGIHSGYRMLFEDRPTKLCRRLPYEIEPNTQVDLTMSWVLAGPTATALHDEITTALSAELSEVREAIGDGTEAAPTLEIPVVDGTTYPAIRRVIDEIAMTHDVQWTPHERQRLVRLCLRSFGPSDTPRACPYDVVESLQHALNESHYPTPADVERAAATLPPERFRPDLTPTATKLYAALLSADQPLGRTELIDRADISASSYDRRISDIRDLDCIRPVQMNGHRRWITDHERAARPPADIAKTPTPLLAHRQPNPTYRVVSSHPDEWTRRRTAHTDTDLFTPTATQNTMLPNTMIPVKTHRRQPRKDNHRDAQAASHPRNSRIPDSHNQTPEPPITPPLHTNRRGETQ
nr:MULTISPECIES: plasmid replication protein repH [unclassified Halorubrum]